MKFKFDYIKSSENIPVELRRLYESAFPEIERRSWDSICRLLDTPGGLYDVVAVYCGERFAGFVTMWRLSQAVYIEHFAINDDDRGCGLGGGVIDEVVSRAKMPVVLEVEPVETGGMAQRRIGFYCRHGLMTCEAFDYIQPSYETGLPAIPLMLMVSNKDLDLPSLAREIHREVYGVDW